MGSNFEKCVHVLLCGNDRIIDQGLLKIKVTEVPKCLIPKDVGRSHRTPSALLRISADINSKGERTRV